MSAWFAKVALAYVVTMGCALLNPYKNFTAMFKWKYHFFSAALAYHGRLPLRRVKFASAYDARFSIKLHRTVFVRRIICCRLNIRECYDMMYKEKVYMTGWMPSFRCNDVLGQQSHTKSSHLLCGQICTQWLREDMCACFNVYVSCSLQVYVYKNVKYHLSTT